MRNKDKMLTYINQDITQITRGVIVSSVNCQGKMGAGLAKQLRAKYPQIYNKYTDYCKRFEHKADLLGKVLWVDINDELMIANVFGQLNYGNDGKRYTDYAALNQGFKYITDCIKNNLPIYYPAQIGSGLGGADWSIIEGFIQHYAEHTDTYICRYL